MNSKEIVLQQVQKLCREKSAYELLEILAMGICPPEASSRLCEDISYADVRCIDCWREWHKSKLNEVRQNDQW